MLIDWFTVGAQALNFAILVWLLKRFLYRPVLAAIDAREKLIADELAEADSKRKQALKEKLDYEKRNEAFDQQRDALLAKATSDAQAKGQRLLETARQAADAVGTRRQEALLTEAHNLNESIRARVRQEVFAIARRTLSDLVGADLQQRMVEAFVVRVRALGDKAKSDLRGAAASTDDGALVRSSLDLSGPQQACIRDTLKEALSRDVALRFETRPELVGGIELTIAGNRVAWSISAYLDSLGKAVDDLLKAQSK